MYAIYHFVTQWEHYIGTQELHVYSDATGITSNKTGRYTNKTLDNYVMTLKQTVNLHIHRIEGAQNFAADYLSRETTNELQQLEELKQLKKKK